MEWKVQLDHLGEEMLFRLKKMLTDGATFIEGILQPNAEFVTEEEELDVSFLASQS
jgi:hypothetical protein